MSIKKRILRNEISRLVLNSIYKDSDNHESEKVHKCTCSDIINRRYRDKNKSHKRRY